MTKMKTEFDLINDEATKQRVGEVSIIGGHHPYIRIDTKEDKKDSGVYWLKDSELELFAVNILKALKSKHLK